MLALSILPVACFADSPVSARITGGVFQDFAPSPQHLQHVLALLLQRMGVTMELTVLRAGYVPQGAGVIELEVQPVRPPLAALTLLEQGRVEHVSGIAFSSHLAEREVSERMARVCEQRLTEAGLPCRIERVCDITALHAGASLAVWAESTTGCVFGADRAGALRRSAEAIGRFVARTLLEDLATGATVDRHVADQLVLFAALASGTSRYRIPRRTDHMESNPWLAEQFGARGECSGGEVTIEGLGFRR
jgi:RNA 3'-terminal phosphate cyclase (ATP)